MNTKTGLKFTGRVIVEKNDEVISDDNNVVVNQGLEWFCKKITDQDNGIKIGSMVIGDGTYLDPPEDVSGNLSYPNLGRAVNLLVDGGVASGATMTFEGVWDETVGAAFNVTQGELKLNGAGIGGIAIATTSFTQFAKQESDTIKVTWIITAVGTCS